MALHKGSVDRLKMRFVEFLTCLSVMFALGRIHTALPNCVEVSSELEKNIHNSRFSRLSM